MTELVGNQAIESAAIAFVIAYEASQGRPSVDTRYTGASADVESEGRVIEVKAVGGSARGQDLPVEARQIAEAESNPNFWIYLVDNVRQGDPSDFGLRMFGGEQLARLLAKKRIVTYYTLPVPVAEYESAPQGQLDT